MENSKRNFAAGLIIGVIILSACTKASHVYDKNIEKNSETIFSDGNALFSYVKKFGAKETISELHTLSAKFGSCHDAAHRAGHYAYEIYEDKAFKECGAECHSGCYHGATEAFFKENGTAHLQENLKLLCNSELNPFFSHQCLHGIGHGLMAWTDYDLPEALKSCDLLPKGQDSCWTGVFMENIVGTLGKSEGHSTKYLSDDPLFPCNSPEVEEKYTSSCYFLQTSRMIQLYSADFKKIAAACSTAPANYQRSCFESMGRDAGGIYRLDIDSAIKACGFVPKGTMRSGCLIGAVQDRFWDPTGQDISIKFCTQLKKSDEKNECYTTIFGRSKDILKTPDELKTFCTKAELNYQAQCRKIVNVNS